MWLSLKEAIFEFIYFCMGEIVSRFFGVFYGSSLRNPSIPIMNIILGFLSVIITS